MSSSFQIISVHLRLPLFNFTQWKDRCASYSFTTKILTHIMCQVSLVVKYKYISLTTYFNRFNVSLPILSPTKIKNIILNEMVV